MSFFTLPQEMSAPLFLLLLLLTTMFLYFPFGSAFEQARNSCRLLLQPTHPKGGSKGGSNSVALTKGDKGKSRRVGEAKERPSKGTDARL
ncbi:hypothetical protein BKA57DRAFT_456143 [Linnemannia elongata]|nr:hypothetical protein BKA57DRAFT_456143 [Linnemannia elongata]